MAKRTWGTCSLLALCLFLVDPARGAYREGSVLRVPADFLTIQDAVDAALTNDRILIMGRQAAYRGSVEIDASRLRKLSFMADPEGPRPLLVTEEWAPLFGIENRENVVSDFLIRGLELDGHQVSEYGIKVWNGWSSDPDSVFTHVTVEDVIIHRFKWGIELGTKTGTEGCNGMWGGIERRQLHYSRSLLTLLDSVIVGCGSDGVNLFRAGGTLSGNLIVLNGDEGVHTTDAFDFVFRHNIVGGNPANNLHLQASSGASIDNNVFVRSVRKVTRGTGGYGVLVGGSQGEEPVRIANNIISYNGNSGIRIQPAELVIDTLHCLPIQASVDVRNNIFQNNGYGDPGEYWEGYDIFFQKRGLPAMELQAEYNFFVNPVDVIYGADVTETNVVGLDPHYVAEPDSLNLGAADLGSVMSSLDGFALEFAVEWISEAVDGGDPSRGFYDAPGGHTRGTFRCDMGIFGGPYAIWPYQRPQPGSPAAIPMQP